MEELQNKKLTPAEEAELTAAEESEEGKQFTDDLTTYVDGKWRYEVPDGGFAEDKEEVAERRA